MWVGWNWGQGGVQPRARVPKHNQVNQTPVGMTSRLHASLTHPLGGEVTKSKLGEHVR